MSSIAFDTLPLDVYNEITLRADPGALAMWRMTCGYFSVVIAKFPANLAEYGARSGSMGIYLLGVRYNHPDDDACVAAAAAGQRDMLMMLRRLRCNYNVLSVSSAAARRGDLAILADAFAVNADPRSPFRVAPEKLQLHTAIIASRSGSVETLKWLRETTGFEPAQHLPSLLESAAAENELDVVKYLLETFDRDTLEANYAFSHFALHGNVPALEYLLNKGALGAEDVIEQALWTGKVDVAQWAVDHGYKVDRAAYRGAIDGGHVPALQWLYDDKTKATLSPLPASWVLEGLAKSGHLPALRWMVANGFTCDEKTFAAAVLYPDILQWLSEIGCPHGGLPRELVTHELVETMVRWAEMRGFGQTIPDGALAARAWVQENNCPWPWPFVRDILADNLIRPNYIRGAHDRVYTHGQ